MVRGPRLAAVVAVVIGVSAVVAAIWGSGVGSRSDAGDRGSTRAPLQESTVSQQGRTGPTAIYDGPGTSSDRRVAVDFDRSRLHKLLSLDAIRPVYEPRFIPADEASLPEGAHVMGVAINGQARAYPVFALEYREMVNDMVGGVPLLVTW